MTKEHIEDLLKQCPSVYKLVVLAAKRAKELAEGSPKLIETDTKKITSLALEEVRQGKVVYQPSQEELASRPSPSKKRTTAKEKRKS